MATHARNEPPSETLAFWRTRAEQLQQALESRVVIEQAKGILAERFRLEIDTAFAVLRATARRRRIKIHDLAAQVVASRSTPEAIRQTLGPEPDGRSPGSSRQHVTSSP